MTRGKKIAFGGIAVVGLGALAMVLGKRGIDMLGTDDDPWAGAGAGGNLGGRTVDLALQQQGYLPPGAVLVTGPNFWARAAAIGLLKSKGADYAVIGDPKILDAFVQDELKEGLDIETADFAVVGISPDGKVARTFAAPPRTFDEFKLGVDDIIAFTGQAPVEKK